MMPIVVQGIILPIIGSVETVQAPTQEIVMPVTMQDVVRSLTPDEADLNQAATALGPQALPYLEALVMGPDAMLASKATYVAGRITDPRTIRVLQLAATRADKMVRVAAATTVQFLPPNEAELVLRPLLVDSDPELRRIAVEMVPPQLITPLRSVLEMLTLTDPYPVIRGLSADALARSPQP